MMRVAGSYAQFFFRLFILKYRLTRSWKEHYRDVLYICNSVFPNATILRVNTLCNYSTSSKQETDKAVKTEQLTRLQVLLRFHQFMNEIFLHAFLYSSMKFIHIYFYNHHDNQDREWSSHLEVLVLSLYCHSLFPLPYPNKLICCHLYYGFPESKK